MSWILFLSLPLALAQETDPAAAPADAASPDAPSSDTPTDLPPEELLATSAERDEAAVPRRPDRSRPPVVTPADARAMPAPEVREIAGIPVHLVSLDGVKDVEIGVRYHIGQQALGEVDAFTVGAIGWLQNVATASYGAAELQVAEDLIGAGTWADETSVVRHELGVTVPRSDLETGLELLQSVALEPSYPRREVKRYATESARGLMDLDPLHAPTIAGRASFYGWYPQGSPYAERPEPERYRKLRRRTLIDLHGELQDRARKDVLVVGDIGFDELEPLLTPLLTELGQGSEAAAWPETEVLQQDRVIAVDLPGAAQTELRLVMAAPPLGHEDAAAFDVANFIYGGAFLSRLNSNLREEKGLTYGSRSSYSPDHVDGRWVVQTDVAAANTRVAIEEIRKEIALLAEEGPTRAELNGASDVPMWNESLLTAGSAYGLYDELRWRGEDVKEARARVQASAGLSTEQVRDAFATWTSPDEVRLWVVVGPKATLADQLDALGLEPQWVPAADAVRGAGL